MKQGSPRSSFLQGIRVCLSNSDRPVKKLILFTIFLGFTTAVAEYFFALLIQDFFAHMGFLEVKVGGIFRSSSLNTAIIFLLGIALVRSISEGLKIYVARLAQQRFAQYNRYRLVRLAISMAGRISTGKILSLFSDEINRASTSILNLAMFLIQAMMGIGLLCICLINFPYPTTIGLLMLFAFYIPLKFFERKVSKTGYFLSEEWEKTNFILSEGIRNNFYLRVIGKIDNEIQRASDSLQNYLGIFKNAFRLIAVRSATPSFLGVFIIVTIAYTQKTYSSFGENFRFIEFFYLFLRFTQSVSQSVSTYGEFKINIESAHRLNDWLGSHEHEIFSKQTIPPKEIPAPDELSVEGLSHKYDDKFLFENISFNLKKGDVLVITGESGVGKSTLLSLLLGIISPTKGKIAYGGTDLQEIKMSLLPHISYVGPHPFLLEGTIKDNLLYGVHSPVSDVEIRQALKICCLEDMIASLPQGLATLLNEIASTLSTGQKQRLMIARGLLRKPRVLIMDEATANLDHQTEKQLLGNLRSVISDRICIFVTHKELFNELATVRLKLVKPSNIT